eukprot:1724838-Pleurochrysis_carterae.AAC.5
MHDCQERTHPRRETFTCTIITKILPQAAVLKQKQAVEQARTQVRAAACSNSEHHTRATYMLLHWLETQSAHTSIVALANDEFQCSCHVLIES